MTKTRKILISTLAFFSTATFALGGMSLGGFQGKKVVAEDATLPYNAVNIEDLVTTVDNISSDFRFHIWATDYLTTDSVLNTLNSDTSNSNKYAVYTDVATDADKNGDYVMNYNDYAGNLSFYSAKKTASLVTLRTSAKNDVVTFRTRYSASQPFTVYARFGMNGGNSAEPASGYRAILFNGDTVVDYAAPYQIVDTSGVQTFAADGLQVNGEDKATYTAEEIVTTYNTANDTEISALSDLLTDGEIITISYGVYTDGSDTKIYLKVVDDSGKTVIEQTTLDTLPQTKPSTTGEKYRGYNYTGTGGSEKKFFAFDVRAQTAARNALMLAGVNSPIYATADGETSYTVAEAQTSGNTLSTVTLPQGWTFDNPEEMILPGTREYSAKNLAAEYYGNIPECIVTITGTEVAVRKNIEDIVGTNNVFDSFTYFPEGKTNFSTTATKEYPLNVLNETDEGIKYGIYTNVATAEDKYTIDSTDYITNYNADEGNLSFYNSSKTIAGIQINGIEDRNTILTFKTKYKDIRSNPIDLYIRATTNNRYNVDKKEGYKIVLCNSWSTAVGFYAAENNTWVSNAFETGTATAGLYKHADVLSISNQLTGDSYTDFTNILKKDDTMTISYGAYDVGERTFIYLRIYNDTRNLLIFEKTLEDTKASEHDTDNTGKYFYINTQHLGDSKYYNAFFLGGVNSPILAPTATAEGDYKELDKYSDVTLPEGYTLKASGDTLLGADENKLLCTYTGEYNGKAYTRDAYVTVNATPLERYTISYKNGTTDTVIQGQEYTLSDETAGVIGFKMADGFYPNGYKFTPNADVEVETVTYNFATLEGAAVRMVNDDKGYAGLRFTASVNKADYEANKTVVAVKHVMIPTDMIEGTFDYNEAGGKQLTVSEEDFIEVGDNYEVNFGVTDILYSNFARNFSALTYLEVRYTTGETAYIAADYDEADHSRSVYQRAREVYAKGGLSENNTKYLTDYINSVLELKIEGGVLVDGSANNGLNLTKIFEVVEGTATSVTVKLVEGQDFPAFLAGAAKNIPVILWNSTTEYTRIVTPTIAYNEAAMTYTITFAANS